MGHRRDVQRLQGFKEIVNVVFDVVSMDLPQIRNMSWAVVVNNHTFQPHRGSACQRPLLSRHQEQSNEQWGRNMNSHSEDPYYMRT